MILEGVTKRFSGEELLNIKRQLSCGVEKWCDEPLSDSAVLRIKHPKRGGDVEVRLFFNKKSIFAAQVKKAAVVGDYEISFSGVDTILYHRWAGEGAGVEFQRNKIGENPDILRIFSKGVIRAEARFK